LHRARASLRRILEVPGDEMERTGVSGHVDVGSTALLHLSKEELR